MQPRCKKRCLPSVSAMAADASLLIKDDVALLNQPLTKPLPSPAQPRFSGRQAQAVTCCIVSLSRTLQVTLLDNVGIFLGAVGKRTVDAVSEALKR